MSSPRRSFLSKYDTVSQYTCKVNPIYTHKDSTIYPTQTFAKLSSCQPYMQIPQTAKNEEKKTNKVQQLDVYY